MVDQADKSPEPELPLGIDPMVSRRIFLALLALCAGGVASVALFRAQATPPPAAIAGDPLLVEGHVVYVARCVSCHGETGRGDGPIARQLPPPRVGDLTDAEWKHGDRPEQVRAVVAQGIPETVMPGWKTTLTERELRGVSAYVYYLAGRPVPEALRAP
jgi:mono/diheme cytochrome c family protein